MADFFSISFWVGLIIGIIAAAYYISQRKLSKKMYVANAIRSAEKLRLKYREQDVEGVEEYKKTYLEGKEYYTFDRRYPNPYQLWCDIVLYVGYKYACYDFNEYDSQEWHDIVEKTFGNKSFALSKFDAVNELLNRSTKYYMSGSGWIKDQKTEHFGIKDYADDNLYEMLAYILHSSYEDNFKFGEYSEIEDPTDQYDKGSYYLACMQLEKDNNIEGIKYLEKAALSGMPKAQLKLGLIYYMGERARKNDLLAFQWFMKAAEAGDAGAMYFVGYCLYNGTGCKKNFESSAMWLTKSASLDDGAAQELLGVMYLNGEGVDKDAQKAFDLLSKAANKGYTDSQYALALMYARGVDVPFDKEKALYWLNKSIATNKSHEEDKKEVLDFIKKNEE
ncbi:tetratricopeptide repeat protein [Butyrivibrio fibrisolvens]|uniref:tetratricopeptide repeat protein n=1 Tax=Butyrivibrio fibrisolvens TaxID=831 RepID=UPI0004050474|nr:tetratricopeptide repeat protein [Butyrivibrio fibrisolvens]